MTVTVDSDFAEFERMLANLIGSSGDACGQITEGLADEWVDVARQRVGVDTGQLRARTGLSRLTTSRSSGEAWVIADTPYAGFHNYGNRYTPPNRFWNHGRDSAEQLANSLGGKIGTSIERALVSGGVWNPRNLF
jgi:phage gpG-like protein